MTTFFVFPDCLSLCVQFLEHMLTADLDFALVFSGLCEIIDKLHP